MRPICTFVHISIALLLASTLAAQTRERGPWWPHPIWGADDQAGASNWITPDKILDALQLVTTGKTYELGYVDESSMLFVGSRSYADSVTFR